MLKKLLGLSFAVLMSAAGVAEGGGGEGAAPAEEAKVKEPGVGDLAKALIRDGKSNEEVLAAIKAQFPEAKTSMASVNWYRNNLRTLGEDVPTARSLKAKSKADEKAAKAKAKEEAKAAKAAEREAKKAEKAKAKQAEKDAKAAAKAAAQPAPDAPAADTGAGQEFLS
jgi:peptidoglycan hydrolase CwlO-like protein